MQTADEVRKHPTIGPLIDKYAPLRHVDPNLIAALIAQESGGDPQAISHDKKGNPIAYGLTQFTPATAAQYGVTDISQLLDPETSVRISTEFIGDLLNDTQGDIATALTGYHSGLDAARNPEKLGPIGKRYAPEVMSRMPGGSVGLTQSIFSENSGEPQNGSRPVGSYSPELNVDPVFEDIFGKQAQSVEGQATLKPGPEAVMQDIFGTPGKVSAPSPFGSTATIGDTIGEIVADQLEPFNLFMLAASIPVGGWAYRATAGMLGLPIIKGVATKLTANALASTGAVAAGKALLPRMAEGATISTVFASAELFEKPPEGSTRMGQFFRALAFNEAFDGLFLGLGFPFRLKAHAKFTSEQTFALSVAHGATPDVAAADALLTKIGELRKAGVPDDILSLLANKSAEIAGESPFATITRLRSRYMDQSGKSGNAIALGIAQKYGLNPKDVDEGFYKLSERLYADSLKAQWRAQSEETWKSFLGTAPVKGFRTGATQAYRESSLHNLQQKTPDIRSGYHIGRTEHRLAIHDLPPAYSENDISVFHLTGEMPMSEGPGGRAIHPDIPDPSQLAQIGAFQHGGRDYEIAQHRLFSNLTRPQAEAMGPETLKEFDHWSANLEEYILNRFVRGNASPSEVAAELSNFIIGEPEGAAIGDKLDEALLAATKAGKMAAQGAGPHKTPYTGGTKVPILGLQGVINRTFGKGPGDPVAKARLEETLKYIQNLGGTLKGPKE